MFPSRVQVGLRLAYNAAFDVEKAPAMYDDFARLAKPRRKWLALLDTHPPGAERKEAMQRELASAPYA